MGSLASLYNLNSLQQDHFFCLFVFFSFVLFCFCFFLFFCGFLLIRHAPVNRQVFGVVVVMTWTENWLKALRWRWVLKDFLCCYQHSSSASRCFIFERLLSLPYCTLTQTHQLSLQWRTAEPWPLLSLLLKFSSWFVTGTWMATCSVLKLGFKVRASISYHTYYLPCRLGIKPSRNDVLQLNGYTSFNWRFWAYFMEKMRLNKYNFNF